MKVCFDVLRGKKVNSVFIFDKFLKSKDAVCGWLVGKLILALSPLNVLPLITAGQEYERLGAGSGQPLTQCCSHVALLLSY